MPNSSDIYAELRAVKSICDGSEEVKNFLLAHLRGDHFTEFGCTSSWSRIDALVRNGKPIPEVATLSHDPVLSEEERGFIIDDSVDQVRTTDDAEHLLDVLDEYRKQRVLYLGIREALSAQKDTEEWTKSSLIVDKLDSVLDQARENYSQEDRILYVGSEESNHLVKEVLSGEPPPKIPTGFDVFDNRAGGISRKNIITLAANTGGCKTAMAIQMSKNMAERGYNVGLIGFEMDESEYYGRMVSCVSGADYGRLDLRKLTTSEQENAYLAWDEFKDRVQATGGSHGLLCPASSMDPRKLEFMFRASKLDVLLVDYIGLVSGYEKKQREERLSDLTRDFKLMANKLGCVVLLLAQMDEESHQVKYAKAIRHHSSFVWKWHFLPDEDSPEDQFVLVQQEKARNSVPFNFYLKADIDVMQIRDPDDDNNPNNTDLPEHKPEQNTSQENKQKSDQHTKVKSKSYKKAYDKSKFVKPKKKRRLKDLQPDADLSPEMDDL